MLNSLARMLCDNLIEVLNEGQDDPEFFADHSTLYGLEISTLEDMIEVSKRSHPEYRGIDARMWAFEVHECAEELMDAATQSD